MKRMKKLLSVILSVLMIVSTFSVAFTTFAADGETAADELAKALKSDTVKNLSSHTKVSNTSSGSGANVVKTNLTEITVSTYEDYTEIRALLEKVDNAVKDSAKYKKYAAFGNDGSGQNCVNIGEVRDQITQSLLDSGYMSAQEFADYNVATFLSNVLSMEQVSYTHSSNTTSKNNVPSRVDDITVVSTDDYKGYLAEKNSRADVENEVVLSASYTVSMSRENYTTGTFFKTNHYHSVINTKSSVPTLSDGEKKNSDVKKTLDAYDAYLDSVNFGLSYEEMLDMTLNGTMKAFYDGFKEKYDAIVEYVGGKTVFEKLFSDRADAVDNLLKSCQSAMDVETYLAIAKKWAAFSEANPNYGVFDYGAYNYDEMLSAYNEFCDIYNSLAAGGSELLEYLNKHGEISLDYYTNFTDNVKVYDLQKTADAANALYDEYKDTHKNLSLEEQTAVYSLLCGYIDAIALYSEQVKNKIFPKGYEYLTDLRLSLFCETNEFVSFFAKNLEMSFADTETASIEALIEEIPENLKGLTDFYNELKASVGEEKAQSLLGKTVEGANGFETALYKLLADRFSSQVNYADEIYTLIGRPSEIESIVIFVKLKAAFVGLEDEILTYLTEKGKDSFVPEETKKTYEELKAAIYEKYNDYAKTFGFSSFKKSELTYEKRDVYPDDKVKTEAYEVTKENLLNTIDTLDSFLSSETFKNLIGGKDLKTLLRGVLENAVFSDKTVNAILNILYPLVLEQFEKVWSTLPLTVKYSGIDVDVNYLKDLYSILHEGSLDIYPDQVAALLPDTYAEAKDALTKAGRNWKSVAIYDRETSSLTLDWGIDKAAPEEKAEAFYRAFAAGMEGLKPLAMALVCNQEWKPAKVENMATGSVTIFITITLNVALQLGASANSGYANMLAPVFEALGATDFPSAKEVESYTDLYDVAKAIFEPIFSIVDKIAEKPVDSIVSILPNLIYALSFDMVTPILNMLKTTISYDASADLVGSVLSDGVSISVGDMLDIKEAFGLDLSKGLDGILELLGLDLPEIDVGTLATAGTLTERETIRKDYIYDNSALPEGRAYTIKADKADVAYYILTYVAKLLGDKEEMRAILSKFVTDEEQLESIMSVIYSLNIGNAGDVAAAVVELLNPVKYPQAKFVYPEITASEPEETVDSSKLSDEEKAELEMQGEAVRYSSYWTKDKAQYVSDNLVPFVNKLLCILGHEDISKELENVILNLYTKENLQALVDLINNFFKNYQNVIDIVANFADLDVKGIFDSLFNYTVPEFENGNKDAFVKSLVSYVLPLVPLLKVLLIDSADGSTLKLLKTVDLNGYNGYNSAIIPLLEGIGCNQADITPYDTFKTLGDEQMVYAVLNPLLSLVDSVSADPINNIVELLPNIIYFIGIGGLQQAVDNVLRALYVAVDVIRPVIEVYININLNLEEIIADALANVGNGIKMPGYSELASAIMSLGTAKEYVSVNGEKAIKLETEKTMTPEFVTIMLRMLVNTLMFSDNTDVYLKSLEGKLDEKSMNLVKKTLDLLKTLGDADQVLFVLFYVFFGVNTGVNAIDNSKHLVTEKIKNVFEGLGGIEGFDSVSGSMGSMFENIKNIATVLEELFKDDSHKVSSFLQKFIDFFNKAVLWIRNIFSKFKIA